MAAERSSSLSGSRRGRIPFLVDVDVDRENPAGDTALHTLLPVAAHKGATAAQEAPFGIGAAWQLGESLYTQVQDNSTGRLAVFATRGSGHIERVTGYSWNIGPVWRLLTGPAAPRDLWSQLHHEHLLRHSPVTGPVPECAQHCGGRPEGGAPFPAAADESPCGEAPAPPLSRDGDPLEELWEVSCPKGSAPQPLKDGAELLLRRVAHLLEDCPVPPPHERPHAQHPDAELSRQLLRAYDALRGALALHCPRQSGWLGSWAYGIAEELIWRGRLGPARSEAERADRESRAVESALSSPWPPPAPHICPGLHIVHDASAGI
ncbi:hypothetical protein OIU91_07035 [Streptomyces sp. NBC_01456]|uniref:hypothetical protein n=1 Tax=unclassified Streptomyces TaxID=2593676 RepID=UPI002E321957|nr:MULTISPECIES: hypothetical protein [unclassified Streptomyces]